MISPRWYQLEADEALDAALFPYTGKNPVVVLPTGAGKSVSIAMLGARVLANDGRMIVLQHRAELVKQNAEKMAALVGAANVGVYSAGLKSRDIDAPIILASIQSAYAKAKEFGRRHVVTVDEAHLVPHSGEGMYRTFLDDLGEYCERLRVCGFTATPFRTDSGPICSPDGIFHKIAYSADVARLVAERFLCRLTNQPTVTAYDTSGLHVRGGEFVAHEVDNLFTEDERKVIEACREIVEQCRRLDRRSVLVFCASVRHAEMVQRHLERLTGEAVGLVTGETQPLERSATLADFKARNLRYLVGVDVLTTGFDAPCVDCVAVLRATDSAGLFAQICGRGFRPFPGKEFCLLLDFGENLARHGPLDSPEYGRRKGGHGETTGEAPVKNCPNCLTEVAASARVCPACNFAFPAPEIARHGTAADTTSSAFGYTPPAPEVWTVKSWSAARHTKKGWKGCKYCNPAMLDEDGRPACDEAIEQGETCDACGAQRPHDTFRVDYECFPLGHEGNLTGETIREWVCLEHFSKPTVQRKAWEWWGTHSLAPVPGNIAEAFALFNAGALARPSEITTIRDGHFPRITHRVIGKLPETWGNMDADSDAPIDEWASPANVAAAAGDIPF